MSDTSFVEQPLLVGDVDAAELWKQCHDQTKDIVLDYVQQILFYALL